MTDRRPSFWSTLNLEQRVRLCALGLVILGGLLVGWTDIPLGEIGGGIVLALAAYVALFEIGGLILASWGAVTGGSILATAFKYGMDYSPVFQWIVMIGFAAMLGAVVFGFI